MDRDVGPLAQWLARKAVKVRWKGDRCAVEVEAARTYKLLLHDALFELAVREASQCALPTGYWVQSVPKRLKLARRAQGPSLPPIPEALLEWARRMFVITEANGQLEADAAQAGDDPHARRRLAEWNELRTTLGFTE